MYPGAYHVNCTGSSANHSTTSSGTIGSGTMNSSTGNGNRQRFYGRPQGGFASSGGQPRPRFPPLCKTAMCVQCGAGHVENLVICLVCITTTNKTNQVKSAAVNMVDETGTSVKTVHHCSVVPSDANDAFVISRGRGEVPEQSSKVKDRVTVDADYDLEQSFLIDLFEVQQTSCETSVKTRCESVGAESPLHAISSLSFVTLDVDNSPHEYKAMIDSGTMTAVAKASLVPESCREYVGKIRLQGAFGECVDADLVILKVRLET